MNSVINPAQKASHLNRREALQTVALATATAAGSLSGAASAATTTISTSDRNAGGFWPNGARLAVSFSLMFEGGGQPISGAGGVIPDPIEKGVPDLPTNAFFAYGHYEGIPRVLDLVDKHGIKLSSFTIGKAVETSPDLAQEIVRRGHEAAAHGRVWDNSYQLSRDDESASSPIASRRSIRSPARYRSAGTRTGCATPSISWRRCRISHLRSCRQGSSPRPLPDLRQEQG
jgi:Polysaccharide deacetylase